MRILLTLSFIAVALLAGGIIFWFRRRRKRGGALSGVPRKLEFHGSAGSSTKVLADAQVWLLDDAQVRQRLDTMIQSAAPEIRNSLQELIEKMSAQAKRDVLKNLAEMARLDPVAPSELFSSRAPESRPSGARLSGGRL